MMKKVLLLVTLSVMIAVPAAAQHGSAGGQLFAAGDITWKDGPASLPPGAKFAVLEGDPSKAGFFTMRLRMPDGYEIQPHWHPKTERITVISGSFNVGMGDRFDRSGTRELAAGAFGYMQPEMRHFAWTRGDTVIQLNGEGPWMITYVNPADDPRGSAASAGAAASGRSRAAAAKD